MTTSTASTPGVAEGRCDGVERERLGQLAALLVGEADEPRLAERRRLHGYDDHAADGGLGSVGGVLASPPILPPGTSAPLAVHDLPDRVACSRKTGQAREGDGARQEAGAGPRLGDHRRRVDPQADAARRHLAHLDRRREDPRHRRLHHRDQPHLPRRPAAVGPLRLRPRPAAALPREVGPLPQQGARRLPHVGRPDPRRAAQPQRRRRLRRGGARDRRGRVHRRLPRGHADPRPRPVADEGQDRRGPDRPGHRLPGDPGRAVGRAGGPAALHEDAAPAAAQEHRDEGRRPGAARRPRRAAADPGVDRRGDRPHHGRHHRDRRRPARRDRARRAVRPARHAAYARSGTPSRTRAASSRNPRKRPGR